MKKYWPIFAITGVLIAAIAYLQIASPLSDVSIEAARKTVEEKASKNYPKYKEIVNPSGYVNSDGFTIGEFIGNKVVLVDFMTYSCINCLRTYPYLNDWHEKYNDQGLQILGIHTPEFEFEKIKSNVQKNLDMHGIKFPIVLDNDYGTWNAYANRYWPRKYLIDIEGNVVYDHIGEGKYDETEKLIQKLLQERMKKLNIKGEVVGVIETPDDAEVVNTLSKKSPEIYFGSGRNQWLANGSTTSEVQNFVAPSVFRLNQLYLDGDWEHTAEYATNSTAKAKIVFRYRAEKVFFVASSEKGTYVEILIDGKKVSQDMSGLDVVDGKAEINDDRLYRLIEDKSGTAIHTLEIIIKEPGLQAYTFTFG